MQDVRYDAMQTYSEYSRRYATTLGPMDMITAVAPASINPDNLDPPPTR
jgi:hypothetical protein